MRRILWLLLMLPIACDEGVDPPALGVFQVSGIIAELDGFGVTASGPGPGRLLLVRSAFTRPAAPPDFIDSTSVPNCVGYAFTLANLPGGDSTSGGDLTFSGLSPTMPNGTVRDQILMVDVPLPTTPVCAEVPDTTGEPGSSGIRHECNVPSVGFMGVPLSAFGDGASITISGGGGSQIGAFTSLPLPVPPVLTASGAFNLFNVVPADGVVAEWSEVPAPLVLIEILAFRDDGAGAQILCIDVMTAGQKEIPSAALALVPPPTPTEGLLNVFTSLAAVNFDTGDGGWGTYFVGVGRGTFGLTQIPPSP